ncbi:MAG TPA: triose-phosphate isomerase [Capillimicrobium sp.]|nr:triose-phosphate isomerase [Capillimicrobium sp.]
MYRGIGAEHADVAILRGMRLPLIVGNWKMHKTVAEARAFVAAVAPLAAGTTAEVGIAPPYTAVAALRRLARDVGLRLYAQNMHQEPSGPFTGEISAPMLVELDVSGVILGHSERRRLFGESDRALRQKVPAALAAGLQPILCVGETDDERASAETERTLRGQLTAGLAEVDTRRLGEVVVAYEPVWAIGTGQVATPDQAQETIEWLRSVITKGRPDAEARGVRILYGGSVTPENAAGLLAQADIDGLLVGGASLDPESFSAIVAAA